ncbi:hypothetical protein, partial [Thiorhodococcus minor]|uniref:hypothetical protein n=1 Tax=Thiorhodococcus minor TaxID=57489 RepID=UPI001FD85ADE
GRNKEFPIRLSVRYLPLLPGFAWRNQSMIDASAAESALWSAPDAESLTAPLDALYSHYRECYSQDGAWEALQRGNPDTLDWLPLDALHNPGTPEQREIAQRVGAIAAFLQRYTSDHGYRQQARAVLFALDEGHEQRFMHLLLPLLRKLDYHSVMLDLLGDMVGPIRVSDAEGRAHDPTLKAAHQAAILEFKQEVVATQVFMAVKRGLEILYGAEAVVPRDELAFVSGIAIPCAADVPAFVMGIPPSALDARRFVHSRAIGIYGVLVVDRERQQAVKIDIITGVLPKDTELRRLRSAVIVKKRGATPQEHRRFFDRLSELIVQFARVGDDNYVITGPIAFPWSEHSDKLAFVPASREDFQHHLRRVRPSAALLDALVRLSTEPSASASSAAAPTVPIPC